VDGNARTLNYYADEIAAALTGDRIEDAALVLLKLHFRGMTRVQIRNALQAGVTLVI
jgi:hypothetical protein